MQPLHQQPATTALILGLTANTAINLILLVICIGFVTAAALVLATNRAQRQMADWLNARADAREFFEQRYIAYRERDGKEQSK